MIPPFHHTVPPRARRGFTLVEMLTVMAIIVIIIAIAAPVVNSIKGGSDFTMTAGGITGVLEQARSYAMANNTYVYVGIGEFDATESPSKSPRTAGTGQVAVIIVASRDGTRGYDVSQPSTSWSTTYYQKGAPLVAIDKLHLYNNVHLTNFPTTDLTDVNADQAPTSGNMSRPGVYANYGLGNSACQPATPIAWPLGSDLTKGQYNFTQVIQIDTQGVARIQLPTNSDNIAAVIELYLQPTHGNVVPAVPSADSQNTGNQAALSIDCLTGGVRIFRP